MIVDAHAHVLDEGWLPQAIWDGFMPLYRRLVPSTGDAPPDDDVLAGLCDPTGERLIKEMETSGVDVSVLLPMDMGFDLGGTVVPILEQNRRVAELCDANPEHLRWFFGIDPRRKKAVSRFKDAIGEGAKGLKLYPPAGFMPGEPESLEVCRVAMEHDLPVLAHCGPVSAPLSSRFAHPIEWDEVAAKLPDLNIILGHGGKIEAWAQDAIAIAIFKPNIFIDISLWDGWVSTEQLDSRLEFMRQRIGPDRILWGTDRFGMKDAERITAWRDQIATLPDRTTFEPGEIDLMMGGNIRRLAHID